jgi:hypothetical protein
VYQSQSVALVLVLSQLIIAVHVKNYALTVKEVWANMDNAAYTNYVRATTEAVEEPAAIMNRIAGCESEGNRNSIGKHYRKDGTLVIGINTNKTIDIGRWQINSHWEDEARAMGMDRFPGYTLDSSFQFHLPINFDKGLGSGRSNIGGQAAGLGPEEGCLFVEYAGVRELRLRSRTRCDGSADRAHRRG